MCLLLAIQATVRRGPDDTITILQFSHYLLPQLEMLFIVYNNLECPRRGRSIGWSVVYAGSAHS